MTQCEHCGAKLTRRDKDCYYCGTENSAYESMSVQQDMLLANGMKKMHDADYSGAIAEFAKLLDTDEELYEPLFCLAHCWSQLSAYGKAIESMERAISLRPEAAVAHFNLGSLYGANGNKAAAQEEFLKTRGLLVSHPPTHDTSHIEAELARLLDR
jgi:Tfp pilus assembly protein PilF